MRSFLFACCLVFTLFSCADPQKTSSLAVVPVSQSSPVLPAAALVTTPSSTSLPSASQPTLEPASFTDEAAKQLALRWFAALKDKNNKDLFAYSELPFLLRDKNYWRSFKGDCVFKMEAKDQTTFNKIAACIKSPITADAEELEVLKEFPEKLKNEEPTDLSKKDTKLVSFLRKRADLNIQVVLWLQWKKGEFKVRGFFLIATCGSGPLCPAVPF
jgi:hypothetical protein